MKYRDLINVSVEELASRLKGIEDDYYSAFQAIRNGKEKNHQRAKWLRRDIARVKTALRQKKVS